MTLQTKVWYYFHFWWDPSAQTVSLEKASGSRKTTPSRLPGQIISIKANDAGTNGPQRLLLEAAGLWWTTAMMWDLWSWCHQQLIRLDFPHSVQKRNTPPAVFTQSAWEKKISYKHIWMFVGWMTKGFKSMTHFYQFNRTKRLSNNSVRIYNLKC